MFRKSSGGLMSKIIEVHGFMVEIEEGSRGAAKGRDTLVSVVPLDKLKKGATQATDTIANICKYVRHELEKIESPQEFKVKFGIKFGGEAGVPYLTKGTGEASLEIEAVWKQPTKSGPTA
jgi:hypothetical protein